MLKNLLKSRPRAPKLASKWAPKASWKRLLAVLKYKRKANVCGWGSGEVLGAKMGSPKTPKIEKNRFPKKTYFWDNFYIDFGSHSGSKNPTKY